MVIDILRAMKYLSESESIHHTVHTLVSYVSYGA